MEMFDHISRGVARIRLTPIIGWVKRNFYLVIIFVAIMGLLVQFFAPFLWGVNDCQSSCDHQDDVNQYTMNEVGQSVINFLDGLPLPASPYCLDGCLTLDPHSRQNWIDPTTLPTAPIDLKQALGVDSDTPPLKVVYSIADEVLINDGSKVSIPLNDELSVHYCLNNPDLRVEEDEPCTDEFEFINPESGNVETVLGLEKDLYDTNNVFDSVVDAPNHIERFSGTVLFAKKVVICGDVETKGYDLVIVADDIEFRQGARIVASPPDRPQGLNTIGGFYDYGYAADGYDGGDIVFLVKNIIGQIDVESNGQDGHQEKQYFDFNPTEFAWSTRIVEFFPPDSFFEDLPSSNPMNDPDFRFFEEYAVFDVGDQGKGGDGGRAGNFTLISTNADYQIASVQQNGGLGADPVYTISPDLVYEHVDADWDGDGVYDDIDVVITLLDPGEEPGPGQVSMVSHFTQYRKSHPVEVAARASHSSRSLSNWALTRRTDRVCRRNRS